MQELSKYNPSNSGALVEQTDPGDLLRFAVEKGASVETIERLMAVRRELKQESAKAAFDASMAAFQAECPCILKSVDGAQKAYKFAPLDHIVEQTRALREKHGFSHSIDSEVTQGWVASIITVTHRAGHFITKSFKVPIDERATMASAPQKYGGAQTFSERKAFCMAFGIVVAGEDKDGQGARTKQGLKSLRGEPKAIEGSSGATDKTRAWMIGKLEPIRQDATGYMIEKGWIMPNEGLEHCPLSKVPTTPAQVGTLAAEIEKWAGR